MNMRHPFSAPLEKKDGPADNSKDALAQAPATLTAASSDPAALDTKFSNLPNEIKNIVVQYSALELDKPTPTGEEHDPCCSTTASLWLSIFNFLSCCVDIRTCEPQDDGPTGRVFGCVLSNVVLWGSHYVAGAAVATAGTVLVTGPMDTFSFFKRQHADRIERRVQNEVREYLLGPTPSRK